MNEFELKFEVPASSLKRLSAAVHAKKPQLQTLRACYFDTLDGALAASGLVLRMRKEGNCWVQTAKGLTSNSLDRLEHNVIIANSKSMPRIDLDRHNGELVGKKITKALKLNSKINNAELIALYETDVQRLKFKVKHAGSIIEFALDQGMVVNGARSVALCELEIELKDGQAEHVVELARLWCAQYGLWLSTITKSMKGQRLHDTSLNEHSLSQKTLNEQQRSALIAITPKYKCNANGSQITKAIFQSCLNQVLANASEIADGSYHATHIHQLRVGIRRLRTAIDELKVLESGIDPIWEAALIKVFSALGKHRDYDHLVHHLQPQILTAGAPNINIDPDNSSLPDVGLMIRSAAFQDTLLRMIEYTNALKLDEKSVKSNHKAAKKYLVKRLDKLYLQFIKKSEKFLLLSETQQHCLRKHFKRMRYLTEFSAPLFYDRAYVDKTKSFIAILMPVQDALGFYIDELMALQTYRELANADKRAWFGAGWLSARQQPNSKACQQALKIFINKCRKNKPFWY